MMVKRISYILLPVLLSIYLQACDDKTDFQPSPEDLYNSEELRVITTWFNDKHHTISVLYGNEQAVAAPVADIHIHHVGEQYTLVTWHQQNNPLWFGGQINGRIASVEQVNITTSASGDIEPRYRITYHERADSVSGTLREQVRIDYILTRRKAGHL
jgi:hypothetical protein